MRANIGDVVVGGGAVLMVVALARMVLDLITGVAPGTPLIMMLSFALLVVVALVWRFEQAAAQQVSPTVSLLEETRRRRAALAWCEQTDESTPQTRMAA